VQKEFILVTFGLEPKACRAFEHLDRLGLDKERHCDHDNQPSSVVTDSSDGREDFKVKSHSLSSVYSVFSFATLYHYSSDLLGLWKADEWIIA
jgi:hypothetical protein